MRTKLTISLVLILIVTGLFSVTPRVAHASTTVGPFAGSSPDSGTCGNDWANDTFDRLFGSTPSHFTEKFEHGTFVTVAGKSPGACENGDNGNTVVAGVTGTFSGSFVDASVSGATQFTPGACTQATCGTTAGFVHTVYGPGASYEVNDFNFDYHVCDGRSWRNASSNHGGNQGDIAGGLPAKTGACAPQAQWFNPGDDRVDPRPGDRLAVYCNPTAKPPSIVVYGIADNVPDWQKGFWLATFVNADLLKAGPKGITKDLGPGNGTVSMMQDGKGHFYVAWNGGKFGANGHGDFSKSFTCSFPS